MKDRPYLQRRRWHVALRRARRDADTVRLRAADTLHRRLGAIPASRAVLFSIPAGWFGDWHPTPHRQLYVNLSGRLEVSVSDGETRVFEPGDIALVEDVLEPGHTTRAIGDEPSTGIFVHLAESERA